jgi:hypothetical protein
MKITFISSDSNSDISPFLLDIPEGDITDVLGIISAEFNISTIQDIEFLLHGQVLSLPINTHDNNNSSNNTSLSSSSSSTSTTPNPSTGAVTTLGSLGVKDGDMIIVRNKRNSTVPLSTSSSTSSTSSSSSSSAPVTLDPSALSSIQFQLPGLPRVRKRPNTATRSTAPQIPEEMYLRYVHVRTRKKKVKKNVRWTSPSSKTIEKKQ